MKGVVILALGFISLQATNSRQSTRPSHPAVSLQSNLLVSTSNSGNPLRQLALISADNLVPLGIVIGQDRSICKDQLDFSTDHLDVRQLLRMIEERWPNYSATVQDGTINILPRQFPSLAATLLPMHIEHFNSRPQTLSRLGVTLWMFIRAIIAPTEGTAFAGSNSPEAEKVDAIEAENGTVQEILNSIVNSGSGGMWLWNGTISNDPISKAVKPYEIYGYKGDKFYIENISCPY